MYCTSTDGTDMIIVLMLMMIENDCEDIGDKEIIVCTGIHMRQADSTVRCSTTVFDLNR